MAEAAVDEQSSPSKRQRLHGAAASAESVNEDGCLTPTGQPSVQDWPANAEPSPAVGAAAGEREEARRLLRALDWFLKESIVRRGPVAAGRKLLSLLRGDDVASALSVGLPRSAAAWLGALPDDGPGASGAELRLARAYPGCASVAYEALSKLARRADVAPELVASALEGGAVGAARDALAAHRACPLVAAAACGLLYSLAFDAERAEGPEAKRPTNAELVAEAGGAALCARAMEDHPGVADVANLACEALARMARCARAAVVAAGGALAACRAVALPDYESELELARVAGSACKLFLALAERPAAPGAEERDVFCHCFEGAERALSVPREPGLAADALRVLQALGSREEPGFQTVAASRVPELAARVLETSAHGRSARAACDLFAGMSRLHADRARQAGSAAALQRALRAHRESRPVAEAALAALRRCGDERAEEIADALERHVGSRSAAVLGCDALAAASVVSEEKRAPWEPRVALRAALAALLAIRSHPADVGVLESAMRAARRSALQLASSPDLAAECAWAGVSAAAIEAARRCPRSPAVAAEALSLLSAVCDLSQSLTRAVIGGGAAALAAEAAIRHASEPSVVQAAKHVGAFAYS
jgi:hypothetical protein